MKNMLIVGGFLLLILPVYGADEEKVVPEDHRSSLTLTADIPHKRSFLEKCILAGKSLGAVAAGTIFGTFCYTIQDVGNSKPQLVDRLSTLCTAGVALVCAAKLGSYSIECAKELLEE